jgi:hypothetical protein
MNMEQFSAATQNVQLTLVELRGMLLLLQKAEKLIAGLYPLDDFYGGIIYSPAFESTKFMRCFTVKQIDGYLKQVDISSAIHRLKGEG